MILILATYILCILQNVVSCLYMCLEHTHVRGIINLDVCRIIILRKENIMKSVERHISILALPSKIQALLGMYELASYYVEN